MLNENPEDVGSDAEVSPVAENETKSVASESVTEESAATGESPSTLAEELTIGQGAPGEADAEEEHTANVRGKIDRFGVAMGTGRRKTSVARVRIKDGNGKLTINGRTLEEYFHTDRDQSSIEAPLRATGALGKVDIWIRVSGGGTTGQAGAIVLGIARALEARDNSIHSKLSDGGFLTRDGRMVERKKYGKKKARRSFQFSKR